MEDILSHLPNDGLEGPESFVLVFLHGFLFLYIWFIASSQLWSMTML